VRAVLVDKDNAPRWHPSSLAAVTNAAIDDLLAPMGVAEGNDFVLRPDTRPRDPAVAPVDCRPLPVSQRRISK
jgi:hypothetical protein